MRAAEQLEAYAGNAAQGLRVIDLSTRDDPKESLSDFFTELKIKAHLAAKKIRELETEAKPGEQGRDVTVTSAIDSALPRIDSTLADQPELRAITKNTIGSTLTELFMYDRARPLVEEAVAYWQRAGLPNHEYADALYNLAGIEAEAGSPVRAESLYTASFAMYYVLDGDSTAIWAGLNSKPPR